MIIGQRQWYRLRRLWRWVHKIKAKTTYNIKIKEKKQFLQVHIDELFCSAFFFFFSLFFVCCCCRRQLCDWVILNFLFAFDSFIHSFNSFIQCVCVCVFVARISAIRFIVAVYIVKFHYEMKQFILFCVFYVICVGFCVFSLPYTFVWQLFERGDEGGG